MVDARQKEEEDTQDFAAQPTTIGGGLALYVGDRRQVKVRSIHSNESRIEQVLDEPCLFWNIALLRCQHHWASMRLPSYDLCDSAIAIRLLAGDY